MSAVIGERLGWVPKSSNLSATIERAYRYASEQAQRHVTLEHLLLALTEDPDAAAVFSACNIEIDRVRDEVADMIGHLDDRQPPYETSEPVDSDELRRIFDYASAAAQQSRRQFVDGAVVLAAVIGDGKSPAAELLKQNGLTFDVAIKSLRQNSKKSGPAPGAASDEPGPPVPSRAPTTAPHTGTTIATAGRAAPPSEPESRAPLDAPLPAPGGRRADLPPAPDLEPAKPDPNRLPDGPLDPGAREPAPPGFSKTGGEAEASDDEIDLGDPRWSVPDIQVYTPPPAPPQVGLPPSDGWPKLPGGTEAGEGRAGSHGAQPTEILAEPRPHPERRSRPGSPPEDPRARRLPAELARGAPALGVPPQSQPAGPAAGRGSGGHGDILPGKLVENIPRRMRVDVPETVEVRIAKQDVEVIAREMAGRGTPVAHNLRITRAMSVRLRARKGEFVIEAGSPETQWVENTLGLVAHDFASWRWRIRPLKAGRSKLQLVVSAHSLGPDGVIAETALPEQVFDIAVRVNYAKLLGRMGGWLLAALAGGAIGAFGQGLFEKVQALLN